MGQINRWVLLSLGRRGKSRGRGRYIFQGGGLDERIILRLYLSDLQLLNCTEVIEEEERWMCEKRKDK